MKTRWKTNSIYEKILNGPFYKSYEFLLKWYIKVLTCYEILYTCSICE